MGRFREPFAGRHYQDEPQVVGQGVRSWITRGRNFAIVYTEAEAGAAVSGAFVDEQVIYIVEGRLRIAAGVEEAVLAGEGLAIAPPGEVVIVPEADAAFIQVVTDLEEMARNAANGVHYADRAPEVTPTEAWPMPKGGYRLRTYALADIYATGGMVNAFRTRKLMVVPYDRFLEPRDETQLTPHAHQDFEQASVALEGEWIHHLRTPWTPDRRDWRPDAHLELGSPSTTLIPAGVIHTSQGVTGDGMRLVDVFGPPRLDFSLRPGVVRNAEDYPMPPGAAAAWERALEGLRPTAAAGR
jgi:quercetin dioxygenase-like cupin family protein